MIRQLSTWLTVALVGVLIAGCGSSSSTSSSQSSAAPAATATTSSTPAAGGTTSSATTTTPSVPTSVPTTAAGVAQAVAACKSIIKSEPTLSTSLKVKVEGICNKAANGDLAGAKTAAKEVCAEVINASPIPAAIKAQALAACQRS
jgi:hypothetical protein